MEDESVRTTAAAWPPPPLTSPPLAHQKNPSQNPKSDRVIVKVEAGDTEAAGQQLADATGLSYTADLGGGLLVLAAQDDPPRAAAAVLAISEAAAKNRAGQPPASPLDKAVAAARVDFVEEDYVLQTQAQASECTSTSCSGMWGMTRIKAPQAWGLVSAAAIAPSSATVLGAVIDTGVQYSHIELDTQVVQSLGATFWSGALTGDGSDDNAHGTHCTGTMAAEWGGALGTLAGVNGNADIVPCKFLNVNGTVSWLFAGCLSLGQHTAAA